MKGTKLLTKVLSIIGALAVVVGLLFIFTGIADGSPVNTYVGIGSFIGGFMIYAINEIIVLLNSINSKLDK